MRAAIEVGIARAAFKKLSRVHQARPSIDSGLDLASEDPLTKYELGRIPADVRAQ